ncbi:MAG: DinB family protein [Phycisphaerales bacterium]|nr:DinB family protein [Phycisphaerales bacterium]
MDTASPSVPQLAPPGAGIPTIERLIGGAIFKFNRWRGTRERFAAQFQRERDAIAALYRNSDHRILKERVLIPRLRGLEDSSRFWSVWMTLDHLRIVNTQITQVIDSLTQGIIPEGRASTAAVKPSPDAGPEVPDAYEKSCDRFLAFTASCPDLRTPVSYPHPWFGPLDGAGWHAMAAMHMAIHKAQIARILASPENNP